MRHYATSAFVSQLAARTRTPVMVVNASGMGASSMRYRDIAVPIEVQEELMENEQVFMTFDTEIEAKAQFDAIVANFPDAGQTTLSITVVLGLPGQAAREFEQIHGDERRLKMAA